VTILPFPERPRSRARRAAGGGGAPAVALARALGSPGVRVWLLGGFRVTADGRDLGLEATAAAAPAAE
jgi:hypothetical protein